MDVATFIPLRETNVKDIQRQELVARYAEDGYIFAPSVIEPNKIDLVRDRIVGLLHEHGFVTDAATSVPTWSGKWPQANELLPDGPIVSAIAASGILGELSTAPELLALLKTVLDGDIFSWKDADDRVRIILGKQVEPGARHDGPQILLRHAAASGLFFLPAGDVLHRLDSADGYRRIRWRPDTASGVAQARAVPDMVERHPVSGRSPKP